MAKISNKLQEVGEEGKLEGVRCIVHHQGDLSVLEEAHQD